MYNARERERERNVAESERAKREYEQQQQQCLQRKETRENRAQEKVVESVVTRAREGKSENICIL